LEIKAGIERKEALESLHAACMTYSEIMAAL
jgi:hypothetical protein